MCSHNFPFSTQVSRSSIFFTEAFLPSHSGKKKYDLPPFEKSVSKLHSEAEVDSTNGI
jgi:hypothetical protein